MSGQRKRICVVGSGNWGTVIAMILGENVLKQPDFDPEVRMWVFEETLADGRKLSEVINETHVNEKYLPGYRLPNNVVAIPDVVDAARGCSHLVFVVPHQFLLSTLRKLASSSSSSSSSFKYAISLVKGLSFDVQEHTPVLCSHLIEQHLNVPCSVLMGANVAHEVARGDMAEATIGYPINKNNNDDSNSSSSTSQSGCDDWYRVFHHHIRLRCRVVGHVVSVELLGALKNCVALAAGMADGMKCGGNTKAALMRIGFDEMRHLVMLMAPDTPQQVFWESCGMADLITTCFGGRNRKCAEEYAKEEGRRNWKQLEKDIMQGQQLQGPDTLHDVYMLITKRGWQKKFPLFCRLHQVCFEGFPPKELLNLA